MRPGISGGWAAEFCSECYDLTYTQLGSLAAGYRTDCGGHRKGRSQEEAVDSIQGKAATN